MKCKIKKKKDKKKRINNVAFEPDIIPDLQPSAPGQETFLVAPMLAIDETGYANSEMV